MRHRSIARESEIITVIDQLKNSNEEFKRVDWGTSPFFNDVRQTFMTNKWGQEIYGGSAVSVVLGSYQGSVSVRFDPFFDVVFLSTDEEKWGDWSKRNHSMAFTRDSEAMAELGNQLRELALSPEKKPRRMVIGSKGLVPTDISCEERKSYVDSVVDLQSRQDTIDPSRVLRGSSDLAFELHQLYIRLEEVVSRDKLIELLPRIKAASASLEDLQLQSTTPSTEETDFFVSVSELYG